MKCRKMMGLCAAFASLSISSQVYAGDYYIDSIGGDNSNNGTSESTAWKSIWKANSVELAPGDNIYVKCDSVFYSRLEIINKDGTEASPITVNTYGTGELPIINSQGYKAGILIDGSDHIKIEGLAITSDAGDPLDDHLRTERYGVHINNSKNCSFTNLTIDSIFAADQTEASDIWQAGKTMFGNFGKGIYMNNADGTQITDCTISKTGHHGIHMFWSDDCSITNSTLLNVGGPGIVPNHCDRLKVQDNGVWPGAYVDSRMFGRGSGIWPINCEYVLIENNAFRGSRGRADSCGVHIDHDNKHVVVQYNVSENNEGGFIEILGGNENCTYRYNVSINDGARSDEDYDTGTLGYSIVVNGHGGNDTKNCYIYNNTIYVKGGQPARIGIEDTTSGLLVTNNIFYFVDGATTGSYASHEPENIVWENNLYQSADDFPSTLKYDNLDAQIGEPQFQNAGGTYKSNYVPSNESLIVDGGIAISNLSGDSIGIESWDGVEGLAVTKDIFGTPIVGKPDFGAIEID